MCQPSRYRRSTVESASSLPLSMIGRPPNRVTGSAPLAARARRRRFTAPYADASVARRPQPETTPPPTLRPRYSFPAVSPSISPTFTAELIQSTPPPPPPPPPPPTVRRGSGLAAIGTSTVDNLQAVDCGTRSSTSTTSVASQSPGGGGNWSSGVSQSAAAAAAAAAFAQMRRGLDNDEKNATAFPFCARFRFPISLSPAHHRRRRRRRRRVHCPVYEFKHQPKPPPPSRFLRRFAYETSTASVKKKTTKSSIDLH